MGLTNFMQDIILGIIDIILSAFLLIIEKLKKLFQKSYDDQDKRGH